MMFWKRKKNKNAGKVALQVWYESYCYGTFGSYRECRSQFWECMGLLFKGKLL